MLEGWGREDSLERWMDGQMDVHEDGPHLMHSLKWREAASDWYHRLNRCDTSLFLSLLSLSLCGNSLTQLAPPPSSSRVIFTYYQETILCPLIVLPSSVCFPPLLHLSCCHSFLSSHPLPLLLFSIFGSVGFDQLSSFRDQSTPHCVLVQNSGLIVQYCHNRLTIKCTQRQIMNRGWVLEYI